MAGCTAGSIAGEVAATAPLALRLLKLLRSSLSRMCLRFPPQRRSGPPLIIRSRPTVNLLLAALQPTLAAMPRLPSLLLKPLMTIMAGWPCVLSGSATNQPTTVLFEPTWSRLGNCHHCPWRKSAGSDDQSELPVQFTQNEVTAYENLLRTLDPHSPLIARLPSNMSSPIPDAYVNWNLAVNMNNISTGRNTNAFGFNRDGTAFFRVLLQRQPEMFSEHNQRNINNGLAPIIDQQWIRYNSTHQNFEGQTLTHHHWMQGNIAIPLPQSIHRKWYQILHPYK